MTSPVLKVLSDNHILLQSVLANFTYLFQPLDVLGGPNLSVKRMIKKQYTNWHADQITQAMDKGQELKQIEIPLKLLIVEPLHAKWLIEMYKEMMSTDGQQVCLKGWQVAGIKDAVTQGLSSLASLNLLNDINPMFEEESNVQTVNPSGLSAVSIYVCEYRSEDKSDKWVEENEEEQNRNIFDLFNDKEDL